MGEMREPECCKRCELNLVRNPVAIYGSYGKQCAAFGQFCRDDICGLAGNAGKYEEDERGREEHGS